MTIGAGHLRLFKHDAHACATPTKRLLYASSNGAAPACDWHSTARPAARPASLLCECPTPLPDLPVCWAVFWQRLPNTAGRLLIAVMSNMRANVMLSHDYVAPQRLPWTWHQPLHPVLPCAVTDCSATVACARRSTGTLHGIAGALPVSYACRTTVASCRLLGPTYMVSVCL